jgi:CRISPR-associated endoribonuclease Cas6
MGVVGSIIIGLSAKNKITLRGLGGEALHGLFFNILRRNSTEVASELHKQEEQKPFTISTLLDGHELKGGYSIISPMREVTFRLTTLNEEMLSAAISSLFLIMAEEKPLSLSRKPIVIGSVDLCQEKFTAFSKLLADALPHPKVTLDFTTPTSFKVSGIHSLFPDPKLVFASLLRRWNAFSETKLSEEHTKKFASIKVSSYDLHTELVHFSRYKMIGFKGRTEFEVPEDLGESSQRVVNALADFATYAGVGVKTAMGMGQTRRIS